MTKGIKLILILTIALATSCKSKKAVTVETVSIPVVYTEMPCGGAMPPPEILEAMDQPRPMINTQLYVAPMSGMPSDAKPYLTDKAGLLTVPKDTGLYYLYLYDPVELSKEVEGLTEEENCSRSWQKEQRFPFGIKATSASPEVMVMKMCNPCEEPRP